MLIVGGGVIGLEIGMAYANLFGTELTIVEVLDQLLPGVDPELVTFVSRIFAETERQCISEKQGEKSPRLWKGRRSCV